jgi:hypothetical protein
VAGINWENVSEFTLGTIERPATRRRNRIEWGPKAVRVPQGSKDDRVFTPCAYAGPDGGLFLDPDAKQPLCSVTASSESTFVVRDEHGDPIGTITRIPSSRPLLRPTWRIDQPERPEIVGRTEWLSGEPKELAVKAADRLFTGVLDFVFSAGDEGGDQATKERVLEWRADGEVAMLSEGVKSVTIRAEWLDRRLAFAYALVAG